MLADLRWRVISGINKVASGKADGTFYPISPASTHKS